MLGSKFKHNDKDSCHSNTLTLHDCVAERIDFCDGYLRFVLTDGFWITPNHNDNNFGNTVRTDAAIVDFNIRNMSDITVRVFTPSIFKKTKVEIWEMRELMQTVNSGSCSIEFISQYRAYFEQMWHCAIRSKKKPYYRECQLHLPETEAIFRWNNLRAECEW